MIDALLRNNAAYARDFAHGDLRATPAMALAVVACMDARMDVHKILGLEAGDAHVIRNAGGIVTADTLRSLTVSQHALGTRNLILIHHTECGMLGLEESELKARVKQATGTEPQFELGGFSDLARSLRSSVARIDSSGFLAFDSVRAFVYDVKTGRLEECSL